MPTLITDRERYDLPPGRYALGGDAPDAVPLESLATYPLTGTITIADNGEATVQRLTSRIPLRVNGAMLGAAPQVIAEGATIQVGQVRMTYRPVPDEDAPPPAPAAPERPRQSQLKTQVMVALARESGNAFLLSLENGGVTRLTSERLVLGRSEDADVVLSGDGISRRHAVLTRDGKGYVVTDESTNGTYVNGARITEPTPLHPGDVLAIAGKHFRFGTDNETRLPAAPGPLGLARLEIAEQGWSRRSHVIDRPVCSIGRGSHNDLRLEHDSVSVSHATLLLKGETWYVSDLCSTAGTFVDGYRVAGERPLIPGSSIRIGEVTMTFWPGTARPASSGVRLGRSMWQRVAQVLFERPRERAEERARG